MVVLRNVVGGLIDDRYNGAVAGGTSYSGGMAAAAEALSGCFVYSLKGLAMMKQPRLSLPETLQEFLAGIPLTFLMQYCGWTPLPRFGEFPFAAKPKVLK
jgi:hypothetical protein